MKPQKHAGLIHSWAEGAEIESRRGTESWELCTHPIWSEREQYRVKHEPKEDVVETYKAEHIGGGCRSVRVAEHWEKDSLKLTFDGETGKLKSAEVIK